MWKQAKKFFLVVVLVLSFGLAVVGIGCASLSYYLTPADLNPRAITYVVDSNVAEPNEFAGYPNLVKSIQLDNYVDNAYQNNTLILKQLLEKEGVKYGQLKNITTQSVVDAKAREEFFFSEKDGLFSMGLGMAGLGTCTGILGLLRRRPGDITPEMLQEKTAGLRQEIGIKESQFQQVVVGFEKFMKDKDKVVQALEGDKTPLEKMDGLLKIMKTYLKNEQDATTQQEVGKVRATV